MLAHLSILKIGKSEANPRLPFLALGLISFAGVVCLLSSCGSNHKQFEFGENDSQATQERAEFLQSQNFHCKTKHQRLENRDVYLCDLNTTRARFNAGTLPRSPMVAEYDHPTRPIVFLSASFPKAFFHNLPQGMKDQVLKDSPDSLEVFWAAQMVEARLIPLESGPYTPDTQIPFRTQTPPIQQLKAHFWAEPNAEYRDPDAPASLLDRVLAMRLFNLMDPVSHQLSEASSIHVPVMVHNKNAISPDHVGELNLAALDTSEFTAFWSYVFDLNAPEGKRRAVATLHWLVGPQTYSGILELLQNQGSQFALPALVRALETPFPFSYRQLVSVIDSTATHTHNERIGIPTHLNLQRILPSLQGLVRN